MNQNAPPPRTQSPTKLNVRMAVRPDAHLREGVLRREIASMLLELNALRGMNASLRTELEIHAIQAECLRKALADRDQLIEAIYNSRSWRLATPARACTTLLRKFRGSLSRKRLGLTMGALASVAEHVSVRPPALKSAPATQTAPEASHLLQRRRTILVAADMLPLFDQSSGGLRLKTLIGMMHDGGWAIVFGSMMDLEHQPGVLSNADARARYETALSEIGVIRFAYGMDDISQFLAETGHNLDWAFLSFPAVAAELLPLVRSFCPTARVAYDMVDFHGLRMAREAALHDDPHLMEQAEKQRGIELSCARGADVTIAVSEDERAAFVALAPDVVVEAVPNVFEIPQIAFPGPVGRNGLLFVGGFWHTPNGDAMHWFVDRIWPLIRQEEPDLILRIAGANADNDILALGARPGIEVLGFVPNLTSLFRESRVFIAPLRYGAGMKGKVGQSLVHCLPVVATSIGAEGMGLRDGVHILVADQEEEFASHVLRVLRDDTLWSQLSTQGREHIERTLSVDVIRERVRSILGG